MVRQVKGLTYDRLTTKEVIIFFNPDIPLVDLHRHLDGNVNVKTICQLAQEFDVSLPSYDPVELSKTCQIQDKTNDLLGFLKKLDFGVSVLGSNLACQRVAFENVEDAYRQGLDYTELRFSPLYMSKAFSLNLDEVVSSVIKGVEYGRQRYPIKVNLIGILSRTYGVKECMSELDALLNYKRHLVGIDLAGDEIGAPALLFKEHFSRVASNTNWDVTIHAGEADGAQSVWDAITELGATRIGHGVAILEDEKLINYIGEHQIGIESCLTSNYQTATVLDLTKHPIKQFVEKELCVSLNTDDPGVSNITLKHEYELASKTVGLTNRQLEQIQRNGIQQAFLSEQEKSQLLIDTKAKKNR